MMKEMKKNISSNMNNTESKEEVPITTILKRGLNIRSIYMNKMEGNVTVKETPTENT